MEGFNVLKYGITTKRGRFATIGQNSYLVYEVVLH